mgnify:CR=1 FL=1
MEYRMSNKYAYSLYITRTGKLMLSTVEVMSDSLNCVVDIKHPNNYGDYKLALERHWVNHISGKGILHLMINDKPVPFKSRAEFMELVNTKAVIGVMGGRRVYLADVI